MLRKLIIAAVLVTATSLSFAEPVVVPGKAFSVPQVAAALEQKCQPDCLVMSREDWAALMEKFKAAVKEKAKKNI